LAAPSSRRHRSSNSPALRTPFCGTSVATTIQHGAGFATSSSLTRPRASLDGMRKPSGSSAGGLLRVDPGGRWRPAASRCREVLRWAVTRRTVAAALRACRPWAAHRRAPAPGGPRTSRRQPPRRRGHRPRPPWARLDLSTNSKARREEGAEECRGKDARDPPIRAPLWLSPHFTHAPSGHRRAAPAPCNPVVTVATQWCARCPSWALNIIRAPPSGRR
jgi:hypothetical protein